SGSSSCTTHGLLLVVGLQSSHRPALKQPLQCLRKESVAHCPLLSACRMREATNAAALAVVSGKMTANSSPPYRAAVSTAQQNKRSTPLRRHSARLPARWP